MKKFEIGNRSAIYLDHLNLINETYRESVEPNNVVYLLKRQLFNFQTKSQPPAVAVATATAADGKTLIKGKRKRKATKTKACGSNTCTNEKQKLQALCDKYLPLLNSNGDIHFPDITITTQKPLPRYWEEDRSVLRFFGANPTNSFNSIHFDHIKYLIPPNSAFHNTNVLELSNLVGGLGKFDFIVIDPPWRNKYIRRIKRIRQEFGYSMLTADELTFIPLKNFLHSGTLVAIWCTNSRQHQEALLTKILPAWNLKLKHSLRWFKLNTDGQLIGEIKDGEHKQPYEMLYIACPQNYKAKKADEIQEVEMMFSIPSIVHSHKPPLLPWLSEYLPEEPKCLELFARYLQPNFTSIGLEVVKLMDQRLYDMEIK